MSSDARGALPPTVEIGSGRPRQLVVMPDCREPEAPIAEALFMPTERRGSKAVECSNQGPATTTMRGGRGRGWRLRRRAGNGRARSVITPGFAFRAFCVQGDASPNPAETQYPGFCVLCVHRPNTRAPRSVGALRRPPLRHRGLRLERLKHQFVFTKDDADVKKKRDLQIDI
jgi:hypothetical protein